MESPLTRLASLVVVGALGALGLAATEQPAASAGVKLSAGRSAASAAEIAQPRARAAAAVKSRPAGDVEDFDRSLRSSRDRHVDLRVAADEPR